MAATPVTCFPVVVRRDTSDEYYDPYFCSLVMLFFYLFACFFQKREFGTFLCLGKGRGEVGRGVEVEGSWDRRWLGAEKP